MAKRVLITTIWTSDAIKTAILKISDIQEIFCLMEENPPKEKLAAFEDLKKSLGKIIQVKELRTSLYDVPKIMSDVIKKIDQLASEGTEIYVHISEGRKTLAFGLFFAAYIRKEKIKGIYYVIREEKRLLALPLSELSVNEGKKEILKRIKNGQTKSKIIKEMELGRSIIYRYFNELEQAGYITDGENLKITELGEVMVL